MAKFNYTDQFKNRHIGPREEDKVEMLNALGLSSIDELIQKTIPAKIRLKEDFKFDPAISENDLLEEIWKIAEQNQVFKSYIGMGYYQTITPSVIKRNVFENPGWYTQYTPYQAEISQGRLEALLNFQTMVSDLTGMPLANASLLDEATAAAEAMLMLFNARKRKKKESNIFFVSENCYPQTIDVLKTRAEPLGIELAIGNCNEVKLDDKMFGLLVQYPNNDGSIEDYSKLFEKADEFQIGKVVAADLMSLALIKEPAAIGADVAVGTTQRFGVPMAFGGPHAGYFATKEDFKRLIPGRIIGVSKDSQGNNALRMALQTREQHIKRERATSNICTAQVLLAIMAGMYAVYHGPKGLKAIAQRIHDMTKHVAAGLNELGFNQINKMYFDTLKIEANGLKDKIKDLAENKNVNLRFFQDNYIGISLGETVQAEDLQELLDVFAEAAGKQNIKLERFDSSDVDVIDGFKRETEYLTHPVFNLYHSETEMMRYIKRLENRDISLAKSMIPLGSCTMKLNAASELFAVGWPEFGNIHPFAPKDQTQGYRKLFDKLEEQLCDITGFDSVSLQPNSGAAGEYAGLMVIRDYHISRGDTQRNVVLIPSSAHGTNPASAVMAGGKVVVVKCDDHGNIDIEDLKEKAEKHSENLSSLMVTYPSTHGVFEEDIMEICEIVHKHGGQVYMDGANMNAQVGYTNPAIIGADVCHLNLHKTFAIPHGGGGPGVGPIGVAKHLTPFLPGHSVVDMNGGTSMSKAVAAAPWGSAGVVMITYAYLRMMGNKGLKEATEMAILNANYIKAKLEHGFKILYSGRNNLVAHELIFDTRTFKPESGIEVEDIAKRLMDYGFHAPTVSFPVPGTLMVEPTESESKEELDRFCEAMCSIKKEIDSVIKGEMDKEDNVLKNAPHTSEMVVSSEWNHSYSREQAAFPLEWIKESKFWPAVSRVDNAFGDRNLMCSCPPIEEYE